MAKNLKNVNLNGLSAMQKKQMQKHKVHHTKKLGAFGRLFNYGEI